jgi:hypothetical protein
VFLNNVQYGQSSREGVLLIERLPADEYSIRVEKPGFQTISQQTKVEPQKIAQLTFKLLAQVQPVAQAAVQVQGAPEGAQVKLDGVNVGVISPAGTLTFTVTSGQHTVSVAKDNFLPQETRQQFTQGMTSVLNLALKPDIEAQRWQALINSTSLADLEGFIRASKDVGRADRVEFA